MKRSPTSKNAWWFPLLLAAAVVTYGVPSTVWAQDDLRKLQQQEASNAAFYQEQLRAAYAENPINMEKVRALQDQYNASATRAAGLAGQIERINADKAAAKANQPPGAGSKFLDMAMGVIGEALSAAIKNWMNNPNEENLRRIEELEAERDRLETIANNPDPGGAGGDSSTDGTGRPIFDDNGNLVGFDRDGDGVVDVTDSNGDGRGDTFNGETDAYADPYEYLNTPTPTTPTDPAAIADAAEDGGDGSASGGGANMGGSFGAGTSGGSDSGGEGEGEGEGEEELAAEDEDGKGTKTGKEDSDGDLATTERDKDGDGKDDKTGQPLEMISGRILVMAKADPALMGPGGAVGNRAPSGPVEDDWNDMEDNGDSEDDWGEDWGDDWGSEPSTTATQPVPAAGGTPAAPAPGAPARMGAASDTTKLVDQLIRVETVIAEWRKKAKEEAEGKNDPYGFEDAKGYASGQPTATSADPLAELRGPDGKLDLARCEIWVIERDSWQEGQEPKRYQITVADDAIDQFDPIHGGYVVVRGIVGEVPVETRVLQEIRGDVKKLEVVQVVLSQEEPPEGGVVGSGDALPPLDEDEEGAVPAVPAPSSSGDDW
jgi:hypothetical protein